MFEHFQVVDNEITQTRGEVVHLETSLINNLHILFIPFLKFLNQSFHFLSLS